MKRAIMALSAGLTLAGCFVESLPRYDQERVTPPGPTPSGEITALALGYEDACIVAGGNVYCWGANREGVAGTDARGETVRTDTPRQIRGLPPARSVAVGAGFACAHTQADEVHCWGENRSGELGDGTYAPRPTAAVVSGFAPVTAIAAGGGRACAARRGGELACWGDRGTGLIMTGDVRPVPVSGVPSGVTQVSRGDMHGCAVADGRVYCWGRNDWGQVGNGGMGFETIDQAVDVGLDSIVQVVAGGAHSCALREDGTVSCWGSLSCMGAPCETVPTPVSGLGGVRALAAGGGHTCAILADGSVGCWGSGSLGDGVTTVSDSLVMVEGVSDARLIAASGDGTCAVHGEGTITCWGSHNARAMNEDGTYEPLPTRIEW